jgi:hypothetical protein
VTDQKTELQEKLSAAEVSLHMLRMNVPTLSNEEIDMELGHIVNAITAMRADVSGESGIVHGSAGNLFPEEAHNL